MKKYFLLGLPFFIFIVYGMWLLNDVEAMLGWVGNSTHAPYRIEHACRDGVQVSAVEEPSFIDIGGDKVTLEPVYLFNGTFSDEVFNPSNLDVKRDYLKRIASPIQIRIVATQTVPIDYGTDGSYRYETQVIPFYEPAPLGQSIIVNNGGTLSQNNMITVDDCVFFNYSANEAQTFDQTVFSAPAVADVKADQIQFEIKAVPDNGELKLNGSIPLNVNSTFTLETLQNGSGELTFTPTTHSTADQKIVAVVQGTMRITAANGNSYDPSISADGLEIAFTSRGNDFTAMSTGGFSQIYKYNFITNSVEPISLNSTQSTFANSYSYQPAISPDGEEIAFVSAATDLVDEHNSFCFRRNDTNNALDVFMWDRYPFSGQSKISRRSMFNFKTGPGCVEPSSSSSQPSITDTRASNNGIAFRTNSVVQATYFDDQNNASDIIFNEGFWTANIYKVPSSFIIIVPTPPIIGPLDGSQIEPQLTQTPTPKVETAPNGASWAPEVSADSSVIAYESAATNLIKSFLGNDLDTNGFTDIYASEWTGSSWIVSRISVNSAEEQAVKGASISPSISKGGHFIAFQSTAINLDERADNGITQVFVRDRLNGCTNLVSVTNSGDVSNSYSYQPSISGDGRFVAFQSEATNLVIDDTNDLTDIFVIDRDPDQDGSFYKDVETCLAGQHSIVRASVASDGTQANGSSFDPNISLNGEFVAFTSGASNLVPQDLNGYFDIFVHYLGYERTLDLEGRPINFHLPLTFSE